MFGVAVKLFDQNQKEIINDSTKLNLDTMRVEPVRYQITVGEDHKATLYAANFKDYNVSDLKITSEPRGALLFNSFGKWVEELDLGNLNAKEIKSFEVDFVEKNHQIKFTYITNFDKS